MLSTHLLDIRLRKHATIWSPIPFYYSYDSACRFQHFFIYNSLKLRFKKKFSVISKYNDTISLHNENMNMATNIFRH